MIRVISSGVVSPFACAVTNGEPLSASSKPIERRVNAGLVRMVSSVKNQSKTFLKILTGCLLANEPQPPWALTQPFHLASQPTQT